MRWLLVWAWHYCPACGSKMGVNEGGVETCPDPECSYHRGPSV